MGQPERRWILFGRRNTLLWRDYIIIIIYRQHEYRIIITTHTCSNRCTLHLYLRSGGFEPWKTRLMYMATVTKITMGRLCVAIMCFVRDTPRYCREIKNSHLQTGPYAITMSTGQQRFSFSLLAYKVIITITKRHNRVLS